MKDQLNELYKSLHIINKDNEGEPLASTCKNNNLCWKNASNRKTNYSIYYPWIGDKYTDLKILVIGENMNDYGDIDAANNLINQAKIEIQRGKRKLFISKTYKGTLLFHRIGCYVTSFIKKENIYDVTFKNKYPSPVDVAKSFDYIAYTNHVKCSPKGKKGEQTKEMWEHCGNYILKNEIRILNPKIIIILGTSDNFYHISNRVSDNPITLTTFGRCSAGKGLFEGKEISVYNLPHPASWGGASYKIFNDFYNLINNSN